MGCVYILRNSAMPGLIKIGYTTRTAEERARELYEGALGVPKPFIVAHINESEEPQELEATVHKRLAEYRINNNREFFEYPADDAYQLVKDLHKESQRQYISRTERIKEGLMIGALFKVGEYMIQKISQLMSQLIRH